MIKYYEVGKEDLVCYPEGSKFEVFPADSCHSANIGTEICVPFDNGRLVYYVLVNIDESNHILMIQEDIRTFAVVVFYVEVHGMGTVLERDRRW